jgi:hypothetical protein
VAGIAPKRCRDCEDEGIVTNRKAPHPGPRCHTHHRARRLATRNMSWERRLVLTYGISGEDYWAIYEAPVNASQWTTATRQESSGASLTQAVISGFWGFSGTIQKPCSAPSTT